MTQAVTASAVETTPAPVAQRAAGSSFYLAMRILPRAQREAMLHVYAFCRAVDDIADEDGPPAERLAALEGWRRDIDAIYRGESPAYLRELAAATASFGLAREDFHAVIDGMEMDLRGPIRAPDLATLDLYCDRVASAVGRLSVRIFGIDGPDGPALAHHLGRALQLTNILRDLDEDAAIGRLYLPREALDGAGIATREPAAALAHPALAQACAPLLDRARCHFAEAETIMRRLPRASVRAPGIMGAVYRAILDGVAARGWSAPRHRVRVSRARLLWIVLRRAFG